MIKNSIILLMLLSFVTCSKEAKTISERSNKDSVVITETDSLNSLNPNVETESNSKEETLKTLNSEILSVLKSKEIEKLSKFIHPEKGIRFSMYGYVQPNTDKHFTKEEFIKYAPTNIKFTWGEKDGIGDQLVLSIKDYLSQWVFKRDFTSAEYYQNSFKGGGNSINNLKEIYPKTDFTENYIPGSEKYSGMDWNSLRFVFEELYGTYYLVAVINDEWTV